MNFLKLQLLIVYRLMKGLGIIVSVLLLCVAGLLLYILSLAPQTNIILVDAALSWPDSIIAEATGNSCRYCTEVRRGC